MIRSSAIGIKYHPGARRGCERPFPCLFPLKIKRYPGSFRNFPRRGTANGFDRDRPTTHPFALANLANPARVPLLPLKFLGWIVAHLPEFVLRGFSLATGEFIFLALPGRRRLILSNLHHAFPERSAAWRGRIGRISCQRLVETALFALALPFLPEARLRRMLSGGTQLQEACDRYQADPTPAVVSTAHFAYWEALTVVSLVARSPLPESASIYRPLKQAAVDSWVRRARERFGMRLLSRREGFGEAMKLLRRNGWVGVLFDQNAGLQGALTTLFGRVCSTTELPGLLAERLQARAYSSYPRRLGFWRVELEFEKIPTEGTSTSVTIALNRWLETRLAEDDNLCASWLWMHDRWRNQDMPARRLRLEAKRDLLAEDLAARGHLAMPRRTRFWIRLPNWLGDVVMTIPWLRAIRQSRPDAEITLLAKPAFLPLLESWNLGDRLVGLPPPGFGHSAACRKWRLQYPDCFLIFTNSFRGDWEAWLSGSPQRFGLVRPGHPRPLLSHGFRLPADFDEAGRHQFEVWGDYLRHFGLAAPPDPRPLLLPPQSLPDAPIGLIAGSENNPEKRWPVAHWRALIEGQPDARFVLFGTAGDRPLVESVATGFDANRVENLAGSTSLPQLVARLRECRLLVTNDTGGMHLANAVGVPLIALFGPTNPVRTGPVFSAPFRILQPPGCPPLGGAELAQLKPETVLAALQEMLEAAPATDSGAN